ncbi:MAG: TonB-dependent receptor [Prevotellaceae bacterium]|nr:TonB-dependent receptor [Prevotellaceae bacterium]
MMKQVKFKMPLRMLTLAGGLLLAASSYAQSGAIKGQVKDASGEPVMGATITANGKTVGITDMDGNYSVDVAPGTKLTISYLGMAPQTVTAGSNAVTVMKADEKTLNDVVVIGYGVAKKADLTGSVTAIRPDGKNKGVVVNPQDMLEGKVAGVSVTSNDGTPGAGANIRIRGGSSLNASNDPLIVIDNVPIDNNGVKGVSNILSTINPQDIESFNILKDASATAIYGSRGSNGVIIITTKKGHKGGVKVSYNGSATLSMNTKTVDVLDGDQMRALILKKFGENSEAYQALGTANTDWQDLIYRTAISQDHDVTVSGSAGAYLPYRVSVGYTDQQGVVKTSDFKRVTASFNLSPSLLDNHLNINLNGKGMYAHTRYADGGAVGAAVNFDPTQDPYSYTNKFYQQTTYNGKPFFGNYLSQMQQNFGGYFEWPKAAEYGDSTWPYTYNELATANPLAILNEKNDVANSREFIGSADFDYKVHGFEDLRLHATLGADIANGKQNTDESAAYPANGVTYYGNHGYEDILKRNLTLSTTAQYYHDFNDKAKNHFDIMGGYEWQHYWRRTMNEWQGYYPSTNATMAGQKYGYSNYYGKTENYLVSFFGRANWSLMDRYYVTATVRDDGSSRFKDHWSVFPSFAFLWKIKDENKFRDINWLSDLKLRLSWGQTGQQNLNDMDYGWIPRYSINTDDRTLYPAAGDDGKLYRPENYTPDLKWETTTTYNVGLDWGILNQRLTGSIDWYYRITDDLLNYAPTETFTSYKNQGWQNIGSLRNTGVELSFDWKAIQSKDFYWTLDYNFTYNNNKITDLSGVSSDNSPVANTSITIGTDKHLEYQAVGYTMNSFYVYQQVYDKNGNPVEGAVVDRNGDGQITSADKYFYKSPTPPITMGLSSRMEYKNWDLSFTLRANIGNYVYDAVNQGFHDMSQNGLWPSTKYLMNKTPKAVAEDWTSNTEQIILSDRWIHNASFLKCDNITLGYSFDNLFKSAGYKGLNGRVYATASNVFTITKYDGLDPEVFNGYDNNLYPRPFSVIVGLNLNF